MSNKYDIESFVNSIITIIKANLSTKITAINAEKNDDYSITSIDNANYYDEINNQVLNVTPLIYYTIVDITPNSNGASTALTVTLSISVMFDNRNSGGTINKVLRYSRCLREVLQDNFKQSARFSPLKIEEFVPVDVTTNDGSDFKMSGVHVTSTIVV